MKNILESKVKLLISKFLRRLEKYKKTTKKLFKAL